VATGGGTLSWGLRVPENPGTGDDVLGRWAPAENFLWLPTGENTGFADDALTVGVHDALLPLWRSASSRESAGTPACGIPGMEGDDNLVLDCHNK